MQPAKNNSGEYALSCRQVRKSFGSRQVLKGVDLEVRRGSILGLLGRNGAGKSTLISALTGLGEPDSGHITVEGHNPIAPLRASSAGSSDLLPRTWASIPISASETTYVAWPACKG